MAPAAGDAERRKLLVTGDAQGNLQKLFKQVENQQKRVGAFDMLLAVGAFLPEGSESATDLAEFVSGKRPVPVDTYFIETRSAAMLQAQPNGTKLCERVHFLGGFGLREIRGLQVAFLSGRYDEKVWKEQASSDSGPAFVGAAYTPHAIQGLIKLVQERESGAAPIDILLTGEWPVRLGDKMDPADAPKHPDGPEASFSACQPIAELCAALEPRYHVFGTSDVFYQRPPFQTVRSGHVCRCIGLGKVGSKGKERLWVHGLNLSPARTMPEAALMQRPENTTPCPFFIGSAGKQTKRNADHLKKEEPDDGPGADDGQGQVIPDQVFLSRLPPNIDEKRLKKALKHVGTIESIRLARDEGEEGRPCKGFGWVTFSSPEEAQAAVDLSGMLECEGRDIQISLAKVKQENRGAKKKKEIQIVIQPHADCWFCLVNPKVEKHMIVAATTEVYVATARGPILPSHMMILPVKHAPSFAACPPELRTAIQNHLAAIRKMCHAAGQECLVWERWIPMSVSAANHMQIQIVPIDINVANSARQALEETTKRFLPGVKLKKLKSHGEVAEHVNDDSATPYIYFEIPGDNTARGRQVERYMYAGVDPEGPRIPINIGRQVACELLGCEEKADWRKCQEGREEEGELASTLREQFKAFKPGK